MPRVLHVIPALSQGGAEKVLADLVGHQHAAAEHHIATLLPDRPFFDVKRASVHSFGLARGRPPLRAMVQLRRLVRTLRPDILHGWLYHGNLVTACAAGLRVPTVWSVHNTTLSRTHSKATTRIVNRLCAGISKWVPDRIVYCAASARQVHEQMGYAAARGMVIENGIDTDAFRFQPASRTTLRESWGVGDDEFAVGCIARFDPQKNHALIVAAFARVAAQRPARLFLAGSGCTIENLELRQLLERHGVLARTQLLGLRRDIVALMSAIDALAIGSSYGEALPIVAIEAAAASLPIVATACGDIAPLLECPGDLVAQDSPEAMAAALLAVRQRLTLTATSGRIQRPAGTLARFALQPMCERYLELYESLAIRQTLA